MQFGFSLISEATNEKDPEKKWVLLQNLLDNQNVLLLKAERSWVEQELKQKNTTHLPPTMVANTI